MPLLYGVRMDLICCEAIISNAIKIIVCKKKKTEDSAHFYFIE